MQNNAAAQKQEKEKQEKEQNTLQKYLQDKLQNINATMQQEQATKNKWYITISNNNKTLHFNKSARQELVQNGVNIDVITKYNYINYKDAPNSYNNILNIFKNCSDIFKQQAR